MTKLIKKMAYKIIQPLISRVITISGIPSILAQTRNDLAQTQNDLAQTRNDLAQTQNDLAQTRNDLAQTRNDLAQTRNDLAQTQNDLTQTQNDLTQTRNDLTQTRNDLTQTRNDLAQTRNVIFKQLLKQNLDRESIMKYQIFLADYLQMELKYVYDEGAGILAFPHYDMVMSERINQTGVWEASEQKWIVINAQKNSVIFNIGANVGVHTLVSASMVGEEGRVIAFECQHELVQILKLNLIVNNAQRVEIVESAVGEFNEKSLLFCNPSNSGDNRLNYADELKQIGAEVDVIRLENYCQDNGLRPDLIIMDIQGLELAAIRGLGDVMAQNGKILFEFTPTWIHKDLDVSRMQLDDILDSGYRLFQLSEHGMEKPISTKQVMQFFIADPDLLYVNLVLHKD